MLAKGEWSVTLLPPGDLLQSPAGSMQRGAKLTLQQSPAAVLDVSAAQHACGPQPGHADGEQGVRLWPGLALRAATWQTAQFGLSSGAAGSVARPALLSSRH